MDDTIGYLVMVLESEGHLVSYSNEYPAGYFGTHFEKIPLSHSAFSSSILTPIAWLSDVNVVSNPALAIRPQGDNGSIDYVMTSIRFDLGTRPSSWDQAGIVPDSVAIVGKGGSVSSSLFESETEWADAASSYSDGLIGLVRNGEASSFSGSMNCSFMVELDGITSSCTIEDVEPDWKVSVPWTPFPTDYYRPSRGVVLFKA